MRIRLDFEQSFEFFVLKFKTFFFSETLLKMFQKLNPEQNSSHLLIIQ
jgi:hypothetical protein